MRQFVRTTVLGGIVFLVPVVVVGFILDRAFGLATQAARPMLRAFPTESLLGVAVVNLAAVVLLLLVCFAAGLLARTTAAARVIEMLETTLLSHLPAYTFIKGLVSSVAPEQTETMAVVLIQLDDASMIGYEVERLEDGRVVVYVPGAPNPWSGSVSIVEAERVRTLPASMVSSLSTFRRLGKGTGTLVT